VFGLIIDLVHGLPDAYETCSFGTFVGDIVKDEEWELLVSFASRDYSQATSNNYYVIQ